MFNPNLRNADSLSNLIYSVTVLVLLIRIPRLSCRIPTFRQIPNLEDVRPGRQTRCPVHQELLHLCG